jgi:glutathione synthase
MDPIEVVDIEKDTTFVLMLEAQRRGHEVLYCQIEDLSVANGSARAVARPVKLRREADNHASLGAARELELDRDTDLVFQRKDPPVDAAYIASTQILALCGRALVLNRPESILARNEKLFAQHFPELMPETVVSRSIPRLMEFFASLGTDMVVKPLDGKGGEGIFRLAPGDPNTGSILEQITAFESRWAMAQRYLPEILEGDKRILLLEGEPIGAVLRVPSQGETRANFHAGGRAAKAVLDDRDLAICERLRQPLRDEGLFFVGIDVIGGWLTEINVTSPTGMQEIDSLDGVSLESIVIEQAEALAANR